MNKKYTIAGIILIAAVAGIATKTNMVKNSTSSETPARVVLQVPFSKQAPTNNWTRNEDCEETSVTMANAFLSGNTSNELAADEALKSIENLKIWEEANLGYNVDTGAMATTRMAEGAFGMNVTHMNGFTEQDLKQALIDGHPILLPIDARQLKNPQYQNSGPQYHMIVIRGYTETKFIVNDPGLSAGNGNEYTFAELQNAAADWNQQTQSLEPQNKIALVMSK